MPGRAGDSFLDPAAFVRFPGEGEFMAAADFAISRSPVAGGLAAGLASPRLLPLPFYAVSSDGEQVVV